MENLQRLEDETGIKDLVNSVLELPRDWQKNANCRGVNPNLFYPERGVSTHEAKAVCAGCQVRQECLEYAVQGGEKFGIWGGISERDRRKIRRARRDLNKQVKIEAAQEMDSQALPKAAGFN